MNEFTEREVSMSHTIADMAAENARLRRITTEVEALLSVLPHANDHGRTEVIAEYLDRALTHLAAVRS